MAFESGAIGGGENTSSVVDWSLEEATMVMMMQLMTRYRYGGRSQETTPL